MLITDYKDCSTAGVRSLDNQLIAEMKRLKPGILSCFDNERIILGAGAHDCLQTPAVKALHRAVEKRGQQLIVNSAYRTIAQQFVLRNHYEHRRCGITAAADVGKSNHNGALAIDIEDAQDWRKYLEAEGWDWIGSFDPMHFDYRGAGCIDIRPLSVKAFQSLWNLNHPEDKISEDGYWGPGTKSRLLKTPVTGFAKTHVPALPQPQESSKLKREPITPMRQGATGDAVKRLQHALCAHGFDVPCDGIYGYKTSQAVSKFQKQQGIVADGICGVMTIEELGFKN